MKNQLLMIALVSVVIGILGGTLTVLFLKLQRRRQVVDSLVSLGNVVGLYGTVEIPFDRTSKGKVRVNVKGSMVDFVAFTDDSKRFIKGDRVFVVEAKGNQIWVVSEDSLT